MSGYGHDESAPTPGGMFTTNFVGVRNVIAIRQQHYRKPFAAVGADLSCPRIRMYPQNGNPSAMFWQTVRSRRGGFIVPAYTKTPTK